jgi:hypothetical protein
VTDNVSANYTSPISNVTINPQLEVTINPSNATINVGESKTLTSSVSGGTSPYTYQWYLNGAPVSGATSNSWTFTPTSSDSYTLYLLVIDSAGAIAISPASNITVDLLIPEFQPLSLLLFMMTTLLVAFVSKRKRIRTRLSRSSFVVLSH